VLALLVHSDDLNLIVPEKGAGRLTCRCMDTDETKAKGKTVRSDHRCFSYIRTLKVLVGCIMRRLVQEQNGRSD